MMFWHGNDTSGWGLVPMAASMVLFWGAVITGIMLLTRSSRQETRARGPRQPLHSAEQLLAARFARGEIDETEYSSRLAVLRQKSGT